MTQGATTTPVGVLLREWRSRRRLSQLDLASEADISTRHLSFVETGRSRPSREMILHLAEQLDVPPRERNTLLLAAGYAPAYAERDLREPEMTPVRGVLDQLLTGYEPYPALVVDRNWNLVAANDAVALFTTDVAAELLAPPANVLRLSLHPEGLAPRILNLAEWRSHVLHRLAREVAATGNQQLSELHRELAGLPGGLDPTPAGAIAVPLRFRRGAAELALLSTVTTFGTALDLTAAELTIEAFLPADAHTAHLLSRADGWPAH